MAQSEPEQTYPLDASLIAMSMTTASARSFQALQMTHAGQLADEIGVRRFDNEAEAAAKLDRSGIVPISEVGQHDGRCYLSMGFLEEQSLSHRRALGPFPPREAAELMVMVAEAME